MTIDEYRQQVFEQIRHSGSEERAREIVDEANRILLQSDISEFHRRQFWTQLYEDLKNAPLHVIERQSATSLSAIVAAAQSVIALYLSTTKK